MSKAAKTIIFLSIFSFIFFLFSFQISHAQYQYNLLEKIPGFEGKTNDFPSYILAIYKFGIWTVGIAALLMITIGGFMYLTSAGNTSKSGGAKEIIKDALIGLVIALAAYLVLYVINPDLVKINIKFSPIGSGGGGTIPGGTGPQGGNTSPTVGCGKTVDAAVAKRNSGCTYSQALRNGCNGNPAYTDCSNLVESSYQQAGCSSPGGNTAAIYANSQPIGDKSSLKAGDLIVRPGHVVMCENDGCSTVIHAPGTGKPITSKSSSYYLNSNWGGQVVRASNYCQSC